jgi:hypothetical protein
MPLTLPLIVDTLQQILLAAGVATRTEIEPLDESGQAFLITVLSDAFEGQTYLDREMRIRPFVVRAFAQHGLMRTTFVIEARTPDENDATENRAVENTELEGNETKNVAEERINRGRWSKMVESVKSALRSSGYRLEDLEDNMFIASRSALAQEKILVGFAKSVTAKTVDLETRKAMQTAQSSQRFAGHYYLVPLALDTPFSNQRQAHWLNVTTANEFLHRLNSSLILAEKLHSLCVDALNPPSVEYSGPIVEPSLRPSKVQGETDLGFFAFVQKWMSMPGSNLMVLMAPAGHGKTTLLQDLTRRLAKDFLGSAESAPVPLLVPFESVRRTVDFDSLMHKRLAELCAGSYGAFAELLKSGRAILLVDGFDELADDAGTSVAEAQVRSMRPLLEGEAKVILAGRSVFTQMFAGEQSVAEKVRSLLGDVAVTVAEILPFSVDNVHDYVSSRKNLSAEQREKLIEYVESSPDHAELAANPLFLRILTALSASDALPSVDNAVEQVDSLLEHVCKREEERQHLGIGVSAQLGFLGWVASDIFKSARTSIERSDVELMASETVKSLTGTGAATATSEIVGRLVGHALLHNHAERSITFIHPLIRDVLLARVIHESELDTEGWTLSRGSSLSMRDLPEGTVQHLAIRLTNWEHFLRGIERMPSQARRNVLRIATRFAQTELGEGNPRDWLRTRWADGTKIVGVDFSLLRFESISFDGIHFLQCDFSMTSFEDCDFRGSVFENCKIASTAFITCRAVGLRAMGGIVAGAYVARLRQDSGNSVHSLNSAGDLVDALGEPDVELSDEEPGDSFGLGTTRSVVADSSVLRRCRELIAGLLRQLVQAEPMEKFHTISLHQLHTHADDGRERLALDRVIVPLLLSRICAQTLKSGSRTVISVEKHWRPAVIAFLRDGRVSRNLNEFFHQAAAKAARFMG